MEVYCVGDAYRLVGNIKFEVGRSWTSRGSRNHQVRMGFCWTREKRIGVDEHKVDAARMEYRDVPPRGVQLSALTRCPRIRGTRTCTYTTYDLIDNHLMLTKSWALSRETWSCFIAALQASSSSTTTASPSLQTTGEPLIESIAQTKWHPSKKTCPSGSLSSTRRLQQRPGFPASPTPWATHRRKLRPAKSVVLVLVLVLVTRPALAILFYIQKPPHHDLDLATDKSTLRLSSRNKRIPSTRRASNQPQKRWTN